MMAGRKLKLLLLAACSLSTTNGLKQATDLISNRVTPKLRVTPAVAAVTLLVPTSAIAEAPLWVGPVSSILDPVLFLAQFMMLGRVLLSWYPEVDVNKLPYNLIAWPTEPLLRATRSVVPPAFGVDISPIVWIAIASLTRELLLGQQGILVLMARS
mmetsp:Transcript_8431/g.11737  ORF Transcript_8431/g.11737 Transcript_8431/m.11737 type:complete len:156 (-) Transcript_8431:105-572(-)